MEANLAFPLKAIHRVESFRSVVGFDWWAVQLHKIECVDLQRFEAILDEWREVRVGEQLSVLRRQPAANFGCDDRDAFPCFLRSLRMPAIRRSDVWSP